MMSPFLTLGVLSVTLLSTRRWRVIALFHDMRCELRHELDGKALPIVMVVPNYVVAVRKC